MKPPPQQIPDDVVALADYERLAAERLSPDARAYIDGGAGDEITLRANREAFDRIRLRGRVLGEFPNGGHTRVELLGRTLPHPILLAPVALQKLAHPEGECAAALAAAAAGAIYVAGTQASFTLEDIARAGGDAPRWFQLYLQYDREFILALVRRAEAAGYEALVATVDAPVNGARDRERRALFRPPAGVEMVNLRGARAPLTAGVGGLCGGLIARAPGWADIAWLREQTKLPILLKGILDPVDALRALDHGAAGVIVSNHGGRTLDTLPASIEALPAVARAIAGRAPVLLDGGVRRGTDVLKALALGANAVLVGRPYVHALAAAGAPGVAHAVRILQAELEMAMALTGCATPSKASEALLWKSE